MEFKDRLRKRRRELDLTQGDLGKMVEVSQATISDYEHGIIPSVVIAGRLAKALGVSTDWLLGIEDKNTSDWHLTPTEEKLLTLYRSKSPDVAQKLIVIAEAL